MTRVFYLVALLVATCLGILNEPVQSIHQPFFTSSLIDSDRAHSPICIHQLIQISTFTNVLTLQYFPIHGTSLRNIQCKHNYKGPNIVKFNLILLSSLLWPSLIVAGPGHETLEQLVRSQFVEHSYVNVYFNIMLQRRVEMYICACCTPTFNMWLQYIISTNGIEWD